MGMVHGRWTLRGYGLLLLSFGIPGAAVVAIVLEAMLTATYEESRNDALFVLIIASPLLVVAVVAALALVSLIVHRDASTLSVLGWSTLSVAAAMLLGYGQGTLRLIGAVITHPRDVVFAFPIAMVQEPEGNYYQDLSAAGVWAFVLWLFLGLIVGISAARESARPGAPATH